MKNKVLLAAALLSAAGATAQSQSVVFKKHQQPVQDVQTVMPTHGFMNAADANGNKTNTGNTKRWYSYFETMDTFVVNGALNTAANIRVVPLWHDSSILIRYSTGLGNINYSSIYQVIDPISFSYFNSRNFYPGAMQVRANDAYTVDSIYIDGYYERLSNKANVVDTLILSVTSNNRQYFWTRADDAWTANYLPTGRDTLWGPSVTSVDSVNRTAAVGSSSLNPGVVWKVPLYYADSSTNGKSYVFKVGGPNGSPVSIPAGQRVAVTATFKTGDTWNRNVDTLTMHNNWRPFTSSTGNNAQMPYNWYAYNDRNMSGLMFSTDPTFYAPSVAIEGTNTAAFSYEYHSMGVKINCPTCWNVGVAGAMELISNVTAFPNPAGNTVSIPVSMKADAAVTVSITNTMGQVLKTQNLGKIAAGSAATATFSTSDLSAGMYFYTVEANGRRITERFAVAH